MPDQLKAAEGGGRAHITLHAVLHAAVQQHSAARRNAAFPMNRRIHRSELLQEEPINWKELQNHPARDLFRDAAHLELRTQIKMGAWRKIEKAAAQGRLLPLK